MKANIIFETIALVAFLAATVFFACEKEFITAVAWGNAAIWCLNSIAKNKKQEK